MVHETMCKRQVSDDVLGGMDLKITRGKTGKVRVDLLFAEIFRQQPKNFLFEQIALSLLGADKIRCSFEDLHSFVMELPKERVLKPVPQLVTGRLRVGHRVKRKHDQILSRLHLSREVADDRRIFQVATLRDLRHRQMMLDQQPERMTGDSVEDQPA